MKKNTSIKILAGVIVVVVSVVLITGNSSKKTSASGEEINNINQAIASQFNDNIRDVSARVMAQEKKTKKLEAENEKLRARNESLLSLKEKGGVVVREDIAPEVKETLEVLKKEIASLKAKKAGLSEDRSTGNKPDTDTDTGKDADKDTNTYPIGELARNETRTKGVATVKDIDATLYNKKLSENEIRYWEKLKAKHKKIKKKIRQTTLSKEEQKEKREKAIPYYTIPAGSDLGHTTLLSALIGEVPNEGKLMQPLFPFSALISKGDLMASNGVPIPEDISGMKVQGYAIGVGSFLDNISCVRAYVTSILFTFQDGHFVVVGKEEMKGSAELVNEESLGYLTTPYGNPCIHGKYFTNAPRVLGAMMLAGGTQGVGESLAQWQMSYLPGANGATEAVPTGSFAKFTAGKATSEGTIKAADWLEKRISGSFDMVFVPASFKCQSRFGKAGFCPNTVSLHLMKTISIDKEPLGRVINYGHQETHNRIFSLY